MRVAIVDDDLGAIEYLDEKIKNISDIKIVKKYTSIDKFVDDVKFGYKYNIVFMDIDLKKDKTGIEFASELNEIDSEMQIIFVTGYNERFSQHIFTRNCNLCGFLVKPVDDNLLMKMVGNALEQIKKNNQEKMAFYHNRQIRSLAYKDIVYMESKAHYVFINTMTEKLKIVDKLERIRTTLPKYFLDSHKSYTVNMNYIDRISDYKIYLCTGGEVSISKSHYTEVKNRFFEYIGNKI